MEIVINIRDKKKWDGCPGCKKKRRLHFAKGLCQACYSKAYRKARRKIDQEVEEEDLNENVC